MNIYCPHCGSPDIAVTLIPAHRADLIYGFAYTCESIACAKCGEELYFDDEQTQALCEAEWERLCERAVP